MSGDLAEEKRWRMEFREAKLHWLVSTILDNTAPSSWTRNENKFTEIKQW